MEVLKGEMENLVYGDNFTFLMWKFIPDFFRFTQFLIFYKGGKAYLCIVIQGIQASDAYM